MSAQWPPAQLSAQLGYYLIGTVLLCWVAVWNGYPLVFPDSGAYIRAAIEHHNLADRPIYYSIFIALIHLRLSLWPVVIVQSLIAVWIIAESLAVFAPRTGLWGRLGVILFLAVATGLPWVTGEIMPDFFAPLLVMAFYLIVVEWDRLGWAKRLLLFGFLCVAQASHYSHVMLTAGLMAVAVFLGIVLRQKLSWRGLGLTALATLSAIAAILTVNYAERREIIFAPTGNVLLVSRLLEYGTAQDYLARTCPTHPYRICPYVSILPHRVTDFLWRDDSVLNRLGGAEAYRDEAGSLARAIILDAPLRHVALAANATVAQFFYFPTGFGNDVQGPGQKVTEMIHRYFAREAPSYDASRQQTGRLYRERFNALHVPVAYGLIGANLVLLAIAALRRNGRVVFLLLVIFAALIGNAFLCGATSSSDGRYQSRMILLLVVGLMPLLPGGIFGWPGAAHRPNGATQLHG